MVEGSFTVLVKWRDGTEEVVTADLPQYLLGEIAAHIKELEDRRDGRLPK